jgi:hypothetical protein
MGIMNIPGFTAEVSLYKRSGPYHSVMTRIGDSDEGRIITQIRIGGGALRGVLGGAGRVASGFSCDIESCRCDGFFDCFDMATTSVCGGESSCYIGWLTGALVCTCSR